MTLDVKPEIAAALEALASAKGLSVEGTLSTSWNESCRKSPKITILRKAAAWFGKMAYSFTEPAGHCRCS